MYAEAYHVYAEDNILAQCIRGLAELTRTVREFLRKEKMVNFLQKKAYFTLVAFAINLIAGGVLAAVLPTDTPQNPEFLGLGINQIQGYGLWLAVFLVIIVVGDYLFRKRADDILDERDEEIRRKAAQCAMTAFWIAFGVACAGLGLTLAPLKIAFPAVWVIGPLIAGGLVVFNSAYSLAVLMQYGYGDRNE